MKKSLAFNAFLWLQVIIPTICYCQEQNKIDSIENVLKTEKEDTNKIKTLNLLSGLLLNNNPDKSLQYANLCLVLAQKNNSKKYIVESYRNIAGFYYYRSEYKSAIEYTLKALAIAEIIKNNKALLCVIYSNLSTLSSSQSDFSNALTYSDKALQIAGELKDSSLLARNLSIKGNAYLSIEDYTDALNYFLMALKTNELKNNKAEISIDYHSIANIYFIGFKDIDKATYYAHASLKLAEQLNNKYQLGSSLIQVGEIYQYKLQWDKAISYFKQAINIYEGIQNYNGIAACKRNLALIYMDQGKPNQAIATLSDALTVAEQKVNSGDLCIDYGIFGGFYIRLKQYKKAIGYLNKSLTIGKGIGSKNNLSNTLKDMARSYQALHNYNLAANFWQQYAELKDSILSEEEIKKSVEMEAKYNSDKKEREITLLTKDKEIQQLKIKKQVFLINSFLVGIVLFLVLLFFIYRSYHTRQLLKLQTLRTKIARDLHDDIGSTLSSISIFTQMLDNESKDIKPKLDKIGEHCRKMLDAMADIVWTINPENDNFEKIIFRMRSFAFELLRSKNIDFVFKADDSVTNLKLSMEVRKNLYLIFKEATNNMAKYSEANNASVLFSGSDNNFFMLIRDNGRGFDTNQPSPGNGLKNIRKRASEIGAKILIESEPDKGTTIQLSIKPA